MRILSLSNIPFAAASIWSFVGRWTCAILPRIPDSEVDGFGGEVFGFRLALPSPPFGLPLLPFLPPPAGTPPPATPPIAKTPNAPPLLDLDPDEAMRRVDIKAFLIDMDGRKRPCLVADGFLSGLAASKSRIDLLRPFVGAPLCPHWEHPKGLSPVTSAQVSMPAAVSSLATATICPGIPCHGVIPDLDPRHKGYAVGELVDLECN